MTQEEYEAKVQLMPQELQSQFRESLEISLSKRIVNRFMSIVMQAYAWGQRAAQKESHDGAYMRGAQDMKDALKTVSDMDRHELYEYFREPLTQNTFYSLYLIIRYENVDRIISATKTHLENKGQEKAKKEENDVKKMADAIGLERLCEIVDGIRNKSAENEDILPF